MTTDLTTSWANFCQEVEVRTGRLLGELEASWEDVRARMRALQEAFGSEDWAPPDAVEVQWLHALFESHARRLLHDPLGALRRKWPLLRVLSAIEDYESGLGDLVRQLPSQVDALLGEFVRIIDPDAIAGRHGPWLGWRKLVKAIPLRDIVLSHFQRQTLSRAGLDGSMQLLLAQSCLHLLGPWQDCRRHGLCSLLGRAHGRVEWEKERRWWLETTAAYEVQGARLLESYREWASSSPKRLTLAVRRRRSPLSRAGRERQLERRQRYFAFWSRQQRAVHALVDLERETANLGSDIVRASSLAIESVVSERKELLDELDRVLQWLTAWQAGDRSQPFPHPSARLLSAEERARHWLGRVSRSADSLLPAALEAVAPRSALPNWRDPFRRLEPARVLHSALENAGRPVVVEGLKEAEAAHRGVVREIERAREVVAFGFESNGRSTAEGATFADESVANALNLLLYQKRSVEDPRPAVERGLTRGQAVTLLETHITLEESRLGALAYLARERGVHRARQLLEFFLEEIRALTQKAALSMQGAFNWVLQKAGWITPPPRPLDPVSERAFLGQILEVRFGTRDLPMLYRRLFRLAPVEDPRFLVGRDAEMQGILNAMGRWQAGQLTAVMVLGARGSGKTSLLNCAASSVLTGLPVIESQFCSRIWRVDQLHGFLRGLFQFSKETDLQAALSEGRRVVILEELERTFLRDVGGFEAIRAFLRLVEATSKSTLWILSINEISFRYLNAAVSLGGTFSHRINAMSVRREHITNAILQRHNLSGLRLEFAPLPEGDPRIGRLRKFVGLEHDAQELFFDGIYEQSEGIFRSAFELWQDCIERVEGGVVHMRQSLDPDYRPLLREFEQEDMFTLQAVLQHGGLTEDELAQIFGSPLSESQRRVEKLRALDILEPDPGCPGFRVRPQAGRFVREALHRNNLW